MGNSNMSFWEHLDELRKVLFRSVAVLVVLMIVAFFFKETIFGNIIFAPLTSDFCLYRWLDALLVLMGSEPIGEFSIELINIEMAAQFFTHVRISLYVALIVAMPFIFYQIWTFVRPALYENEKRVIRRAFGFAGILFYIGIAVGYLLVFPLTVRFLGTYQVSADVPNHISLNSYIGMFVSLILIMGIVFEMPALAAVLSKLGIITKEFLKKYRKHALVILLILAALITPSGDAVTMLFVAIPLYFLYEVSILVCRSGKSETDEIAADAPGGEE
ncbi:MAG TPA: twin-arginine translocase subunit TatC [Bacteroidales bacterium]|nr:twin-arginine translocase subunit TatC [Bacteroidales bacterium]HPK29663.1 twin-arginine translocase subunit TatC [Bacteroidales bacterium]